MLTVLKAIVSGAVIAVVNVVARRDPVLGGWLAALPLITFLSLTWLYLDGGTGSQLARFLVGVLWGLILTALLLLVVAFCLQHGVPLFLAMGVGTLTWAAFTAVARWAGLFVF